MVLTFIAQWQDNAGHYHATGTNYQIPTSRYKTAAGFARMLRKHRPELLGQGLRIVDAHANIVVMHVNPQFRCEINGRKIVFDSVEAAIEYASHYHKKTGVILGIFPH